MLGQPRADRAGDAREDVADPEAVGAPDRLEKDGYDHAGEGVGCGTRRRFRSRAEPPTKSSPIPHRRRTFAFSRMFRRSGRRFADMNMRQTKNLEHVPIPKERNMF